MQSFTVKLLKNQKPLNLLLVGIIIVILWIGIQWHPFLSKEARGGHIYRAPVPKASEIPKGQRPTPLQPAIEKNAPAPSNTSAVSKLRLIGTVTDNRESPVAVILDLRNGKQCFCTVGDTFASVRVEAITRNKALIVEDERPRVLTLNGKAGDQESAPGVLASQKPPVSREELYAKYPMAAAMAQIAQIRSQVEVKQAFVDNEPGGVQVTRVEKNSLFERMGLEADDIILAINGKDIETVDDAEEIYDSLRTSARGVLEVRRGDSIELLAYNHVP